MLPNPTYTGGAPASRNATRSSGSGRSSGTTHAPVCTTSKYAGSRHGSSTGSVASHGRSPITWSRTPRTGAIPFATRLELSASPNSSSTLSASRSHSARLSVTSTGSSRPG